jgi:uncharacterized membrane protein
MAFGLRRRSSIETYNFIILSIASYGLIALMILIPYTQSYYNLTRLYLQMFFVLSTLAVMGGVIVTKYFPKYQIFVLAIGIILIFCSFNGSLDQLTGGQARITLDQPPSTLDAPYIYDGEVASAQWLAVNRTYTDPLQADIIARMPMQAFGNMDVNNIDIFPQTIEQNSYVYLIRANIVQGEAFYEYENNLFTYNYPIAFLNTHKNLIYNDADSRIYR